MTRRHRRYDSISEGLLQRIEASARSLDRELMNAEVDLNPMETQYNAVSDLRAAMRRTDDILNNRPEDWTEPHHAPFSRLVGGSLAFGSGGRHRSQQSLELASGDRLIAALRHVDINQVSVSFGVIKNRYHCKPERRVHIDVVPSRPGLLRRREA